MAYAAVISLKQIIKHLLNSPHSSSTPQILQLTHNNLSSLQQVLEKSDDNINNSSKKRLNALDAQIKEAIYALEDLLEFHVSNNFLSKSENHFPWQDIDSLLEKIKKNEEEYVEELQNSSPREDDDDDDNRHTSVSTNTDFGVKMVGLWKEFNHIKSKLVKGVRPDDFGVFCFIGMAGSGRSMRANAIFEESHYNCRARVTVGPVYQRREILVSILDQVKDPSCNDHEIVLQDDDEELLGEKLYSSLDGRKYIILIDDIRETSVWDDLKRWFPRNNNGSLVVITTSLEEVALHSECDHIFQIPVLDEDRTWDVLCAAMFGWNLSCPQEFEESGKMIAKNCGGRAFSIAKAVLFLLEGVKTPTFWEELAADEEHPVFVIPDELLEVNEIKEDFRRIYPSCWWESQRFKALAMVETMVYGGLSNNDLEQFRMHMFPDYAMPEIEFMKIFGMAGIGKTTLAKEIFEDQSIKDHFDHSVWITLGPTYQSEEILVDILPQIYPKSDIRSMRGDEALAKKWCAKLSTKRCLIVLDDVWNTGALDCLEDVFKKFKVKVLVTTRLEEVARFRPIYRVIVTLRLLNKEDSWSLLCQKVFPQGSSCPYALEKAGKRIAERCDGLPLLILTVADHLSRAEKTLEFWNKVADQKNNEVFMNAHREISKSLFPSYESLSHHLKACFLYMGVFSQNHDISNSRIIKLWDAEGFLEPKQSGNIDDFAASSLEELVDKSVVMSERSSNSDSETSRLHSVFWHLSNSEAEKDNFFHAIADIDTSIDGMKKQCRLCIRYSSLLSVKEVYDSIASVSAARSLLCTGPPHPYPVTVDFGLRLLRVMDVLTIRLYEFPVGLVELIHLRYLALTCCGKIPCHIESLQPSVLDKKSAISNLCSLLYLIISKHFIIKSTEDLSFLPAEIWDMKELKHLHVTGRNLTNPRGSVVLPNLSTLLDANALRCTEEFFKGTPNLKRLGIQIELDPNVGIPHNCLGSVSCLANLESLECVVVNPEFKIDALPRVFSFQMLPLGLRKLSLGGVGYPWEDMSIIGKLQKLEVLALRCYAFRGETWVAIAGSFKEVRFLLLEDVDLVRWELGRFAFKNLNTLSMKHCYKLKVLARNFSSSVDKIEVVECNTFVMKWAEEVRVKDLNNLHISRAFLEVEAHASW